MRGRKIAKHRREKGRRQVKVIVRSATGKARARGGGEIFVTVRQLVSESASEQPVLTCRFLSLLGSAPPRVQQQPETALQARQRKRKTFVPITFLPAHYHLLSKPLVSRSRTTSNRQTAATTWQPYSLSSTVSHSGSFFKLAPSPYSIHRHLRDRHYHTKLRQPKRSAHVYKTALRLVEEGITIYRVQSDRRSYSLIRLFTCVLLPSIGDCLGRTTMHDVSTDVSRSRSS